MNFLDTEQGFPVFFIVWIALTIGSGLFFWLNRNAELKRKVLPPLLLVAGALFIGFIWVSGAPVNLLYIAIPLVALITILNIRGIKFCDACGSTLHSQNPFSPSKFCSKCGAELK